MISFRQVSDNFIEQNSKYKVVENPASVIFQVRGWTAGELRLTDLILKGIIHHNFSIPNGQEEGKVKEFIQSKIIDDWENNDAADHLSTIQEGLLSTEKKNTTLLKLYSVLGAEEIQVDSSDEVKTLLASSLVVESDDANLKMANRIYESVFDRAWVGQSLESTRGSSAQSASTQRSIAQRSIAQRSSAQRSSAQRSNTSGPETATIGARSAISAKTTVGARTAAKTAIASKTVIQSEENIGYQPPSTLRKQPSSGFGDQLSKYVSEPTRFLNPRLAIFLAAMCLLFPILFFACQDRTSTTDIGSVPTEEADLKDAVTDEKPLLVSDFQKQISTGDQVLLPQEELSGENLSFRTAKSRGVAAMADKDFDSAVTHFEEALLYYKNAPETLIYLNNARIEAQASESYAIAAAVPISDDLPAAQAMLRGIAQAQNRINESGGIDGIQLKVTIVDDAGDKEIAPEIAALIADNKDILGVVGHYYSSVTLAAEDTYEENGLAIIALSSSTEISNLNNDYIFRTSPSDAVIGKSLATYMIEALGETKVAIVYNAQSPYSNSLKRAFESTVLTEGGRVVSDFDLSESINVQKVIDQATEQDAQVLMMIPSNFDELQADIMPLAQLNFSRNEPLTLMGGDVVYSDTVLEEAFEDMVVGAFWHIGAADPASEFIIQSQQLWNAEVNWVTAMAYDATQAWIEALKRSDAPPTRDNLQEILSSSSGNFFSAAGASDVVEFSSNGDRPIPGQLVQVQPNDGQGKSYRFEPLLTDE